jgi:hypothetical protein
MHSGQWLFATDATKFSFVIHSTRNRAARPRNFFSHIKFAGSPGKKRCAPGAMWQRCLHDSDGSENGTAG